jgi:hypothetical protein
VFYKEINEQIVKSDKHLFSVRKKNNKKERFIKSFNTSVLTNACYDESEENIKFMLTIIISLDLDFFQNNCLRKISRQYR